MELLAAVAVLAVLAGLLAPAVGGAIDRSRKAKCAATLRSIGTSVQLYAIDHGGEFPRSLHSAGAHREPGWTASVFPYLSGSAGELDAASFNRFFRCPDHKETGEYLFSYAMNVHFELDPSGDDYAESPLTWRKVNQVPAPGRTILLAEPRPVLFGDHLMCHQWSSPSSAKNALSADRHAGRSNFLFVDGHVESLEPEQTYDPGEGINCWNPALAARR